MKKIILLAFLFLFAGEVLARLILFGSAGLTFTKMNSLTSLETSGILQASRNSTLKYELKPSINKNFQMTAFSTNKHGFRDKKITMKRTDRNFRGAIVGGSVSFGIRKSDGNTLIDLIEQQLEKKKKFKFDLLNFSVPGYDIQQTTEMLSSKALDFSPQIALISLSRESIGWCHPQEYFQKKFTVESEAYPFFRIYLLGYSKTFKLPEKNEIPNNAEFETCFRNIIAKLKSIRNTRSLPIAFLNLEFNQEFYRSSNTWATVRQLQMESGMPVIEASAAANPNLADTSEWIADQLIKKKLL